MADRRSASAASSGPSGSSGSPAGPTAPRGPRASPGFWLYHAALAWQRELDNGLRPLGLTHTQFTLLASANHLGRRHDAPTQQQVAELSGVDRMMTSKILSELHRRGLVDRVAHAQDGRAKAVRTTDAGAELVSRAVRIVAEVDDRLFGARGPERDRLRAALEGIVAAAGGSGDR
ncbi:MarR family winged helix-turn-helix transcriptional regulator [Microbacterium sp.]|uniref:MarR family winged helix-turn-helix transcriptional regulator n=1 Tax=Microbacterium sp. TaxID=51671 RepID=UPI0039E70B9A